MIKYDGVEINFEKYPKVPLFIKQTYVNFLSELEKEPSIQNIRDFRYNDAHSPDYSIQVNQQIYIIRYYLAYFVEYYVMYSVWYRIANQFYQNQKQKIQIISVGCGSTCDYVSAYYVFKRWGIENSINYWGIDINRWNFISGRLNENQIVKVDIAQWIKQNPKEFIQADIIIFSKSIGELSQDSFSELLQFINTNEYLMKKKRISILGSFAKKYHDRDKYRYNQFVETIIKKNNFSIYEKKDSNLKIEDPGHKTYKWAYPNTIELSNQTLIQHCMKFQNRQSHCPNSPCEDGLIREPITSTRYIDYAITVLEK